MEKQIACPHCKSEVLFKKNSSGRWIGTIAGGGIGYFLASGLGIAGAIFSAPIAIPAALVGAGALALLGNRVGKDIDNSKPKCPKCNKKLVL
jgi:DNA-directed RNA polymerase subunit RPC12/RpoP